MHVKHDYKLYIETLCFTARNACYILNACLNKEHYRAHINNSDTHTEFAMQTALRSIQTGRDLATRREFSIFNDI
jgi:tRNA threonylcarbamoyladenosine modification (KEOPS) complex Cgi121 subunit